MKTPDQVLGEVAERLRRTWSQVVVGEPWRPEFRLGSSGLTGARLVAEWPVVQLGALAWGDWVRQAGPGVSLRTRTVQIHRTPQPLPAVLVIESVDVAARLIGPDWVARLDQARARRRLLGDRFPALQDPALVLRSIDTLDDVEVDLLCRAAAWFAAPHPTGLTARQVPVEGMGTKWLDARAGLVRRLAGVDSLGLESGRPPRVHLTYLDAAHLAAGGRRHDVATAGDIDAIAYRPRLILVSENRDTAQQFPTIDGGVALEGEGRGAGAVAGLPWIHDVEELWYWGDMDADGLEILQGFRAAGLPVRSLYMDLAAYERWERFGVDHDHHGAPLGPRVPREHGLLEPTERALYLALCAPAWDRHRRIEQERIPLADAVAVLRAR